MKRYVIRKYVMAESIVEAISKENKAPVEDAWLDEKQPDPKEQTSQIGFDLSPSGYYYSPYLKRKKKRK